MFLSSLCTSCESEILWPTLVAYISDSSMNKCSKWISISTTTPWNRTSCLQMGNWKASTLFTVIIWCFPLFFTHYTDNTKREHKLPCWTPLCWHFLILRKPNIILKDQKLFSGFQFGFQLCIQTSHIIFCSVCTSSGTLLFSNVWRAMCI